MRYDLAMVGDEDLSEEMGEGDYFGFVVDAGMGCITDAAAQEAFREYWERRLEEDEDIDPYNDLFCDLLEESYNENPRYQREGGDWVNWTVPGTDLSIPIFANRPEHPDIRVGMGRRSLPMLLRFRLRR